MLTLTDIRRDLREIRYYYARKDLFDESLRSVSANTIVEKARKYNEAVKTAKPILYDLYVSLYVKNCTQEGLAVELGYTPEYIQILHKQLLLFLQTHISDGGIQYEK